MIYDNNIGWVLRLVFIYKGNLKKLRAARNANKVLEHERNTQWGITFMLLSILFTVLLYNIL
jgi:hypothetical protein